MAGPWEFTKAGTGAPPLQHRMRRFGTGFVWVGAILFVMSIFDMALAVARGGLPKSFWIRFFAIPLIVIGVFFKRFARVVQLVGRLDGNSSQEAFLSAAKALVEKHRGAKLVSAVMGHSAATRRSPHCVTCPDCASENDDAARFCDGCGTALIAGLACPCCGALNDSTARTCILCDERL